MSVFVMPTFATSNDSSTEYKYYDKIVEYYIELTPSSRYDELYYYYSDENSEEPEWTLIYCPYNPDPIDVKEGIVIGNRAFVCMGGCVLSLSGHFVYVRKTDSFIPLCEYELEKILELCPDFEKAIEENNLGQQIGDVNDNGKLDILDATYIQRCVAGFNDDLFMTIWTYGSHDSFADFDRDGDVTVLDATDLQMKLAKLS